MRSMSKFVVGFALCGALLAGSQALAATFVYDTSPTTAALANQGYGDVLGNDFTVNASGLRVTSLGAFDSTLGGISTAISVGLYDLTTSNWVTPIVSFLGTPNAGSAYVWKSITPVGLTKGDQYSIVGLGFNGTNQDFNTNNTGLNDVSPILFNNLGGALTNNFSRYGGGGDPSASTLFPHASTFGAASLAIAVPEPSTWALMLLGFGGLGAAMRIQRRKSLGAATA